VGNDKIASQAHNDGSVRNDKIAGQAHNDGSVGNDKIASQAHNDGSVRLQWQECCDHELLQPVIPNFDQLVILNLIQDLLRV